VPVFTQSCAHKLVLEKQPASIRAKQVTRNLCVLRRCRDCDLADSSIRLKIHNCLYGIILVGYEGIRNIFSVVLKLLIRVIPHFALVVVR
jgi:hypothetical protein